MIARLSKQSIVEVRTSTSSITVCRLYNVNRCEVGNVFWCGSVESLNREDLDHGKGKADVLPPGSSNSTR